MKYILIYISICLSLFATKSFSQGSGHSLAFNGTNNYINIGSSLVLPNIFTITFWVKSTNDNPMTIMSYGNGSSTSPHVFIGIGNNWTGSINNELLTISKIASSGVSNFANTSSDRSVLFDGNWHHVAISFDGTSNYSFYVDGKFYSTVIGQFGAGYTLNGLSVNYGYIGTRQFNSSFSTFFNGELDEFTIWNDVLTQNEIIDYMCKKINVNHPKYMNLIKYYKFDDGVGNVLTDSSSSNIDGALINSPTWQISGASIGDSSVWLSNANISSSLTLSHPNGDNITTTISSGSAELLQMYYVSEVPNSNLPPSPLSQLSQINYYGVKLFNSTSGVYSITYNYNGHPGIQDENDLGLASRVNNSILNWDYESSAVLNTLSNALLLSSQTGSEYILGSSANNTLPVELLFFNAKPLNRTIKFEWQTASEINNDYFTVERSINGLDWEIVVTVTGAGYSSTILNYVSVDYTPYFGVSYYRLKQTDFDGQFKYSDIKSINLNNIENNKIQIYPNPTNHSVTLKGKPEELSEIKLVDVLGREVTNLIYITYENDSDIKIDFSNLTQGIYYIKTRTTANSVYKK